MHISRIITLLPVMHLRRSIDFYRKLGFVVDSQRDDWGWAMLVAGECRLMLDESINRHPGEASDAVVYLYVDDVAACHHALRKVGVDLPDPGETFYGMREFRLEDPDGNRLWIGQVPETLNG